MGKKIDIVKVDSRILNLNLTRGNITDEEYKEFLKSLPDLTDQAEEIPAYEEEPAESELTFSAA